jgi:hypothetical protein
MIYRLLGTALLVLVFAACMGPPTQYVSAEADPVLPSLGPKPVVLNERRYGYSELEISPTIVRVTFEGNSSTKDTRAVDFALLRAAEVAIKRGYPYFVVRDRVNASRSRTYTSTSPGHSFTSCDKKGRCTTTQSPSVTTSSTSRWPVHNNLVEFFAEVPPDSATLFVLEARFVQRVLRRMYGLQMPTATRRRGANE